MVEAFKFINISRQLTLFAFIQLYGFFTLGGAELGFGAKSLVGGQ